ncbi:MAG: exo-beta-N-acetylmuramidase NamZ domain-containing protein [Gemmatimonadaceae bacterium]
MRYAFLLLLALPLAAQPAPRRDFRLGVEVLLADSLHVLRGKRVGLITNHTGRDRAGTSTIDLLARAPGVRLVALFAPEHGIRGQAEAGARIESSVDSATGVTIHSLYGSTRASRVPTAAMLADLDVLVYDIQDVGSRAYTYVWTMALAAEAAGKAGKKFVVLDRPNPIRADRVEGGVLRTEWRSFTGQYPVALRYGLTAGEMLRYLVGTGQVEADIAVIPMQGYRRADWWDVTGLRWVSPSPNIRDPEAALLYAGMVLFEAVNLSEGRGTTAPFKAVGAPWLTDAAAVARELNALSLPGVRFAAATRAVEKGAEHGGRTIPVVELRVTDRDRLRPVEVAAHMLAVIHRRHPREWRWQENGVERLSGSRELRRAVERHDVAPLLARWRAEAESWKRSTEPYWLYR